MTLTHRTTAPALALSLALTSARVAAQSTPAADAGSPAAPVAALPEAHTDFVTTASSSPPPPPTPAPVAPAPLAVAGVTPVPAGADRGVEVEPADRAAIDAACRDVLERTDYLMWTGTAALVVGGLITGYLAYSVPPPNRSNVERFLAGVGPGMIVGAIGYPFPRGLLRDDDILWQTCHHLHDHPHRLVHHDVDADYEYADRVLVEKGGPTSALLIWLLAAATSWMATGVTLAFASNCGECVQVLGGIVPGLFVGWLLVPSTPEHSAARRYRLGGYRTHRASSLPVAPTLTFRPIEPGGFGVGISLTF